jgi:hypothetical protein
LIRPRWARRSSTQAKHPLVNRKRQAGAAPAQPPGR